QVVVRVCQVPLRHHVGPAANSHVLDGASACGPGRSGHPAHRQAVVEPSSGGNAQKQMAAIAAMLKNWNGALPDLKVAIKHPDASRPLTLYGDAFAAGDLVGIPAADLPAGSPAWMLGQHQWAARTGSTAVAKRFNIMITVPPAFRT